MDEVLDRIKGSQYKTKSITMENWLCRRCHQPHRSESRHASISTDRKPSLTPAMASVEPVQRSKVDDKHNASVIEIDSSDSDDVQILSRPPIDRAAENREPAPAASQSGSRASKSKPLASAHTHSPDISIRDKVKPHQSLDSSPRLGAPIRIEQRTNSSPILISTPSSNKVPGSSQQVLPSQLGDLEINKSNSTLAKHTQLNREFIAPSTELPRLKTARAARKTSLKPASPTPSHSSDVPVPQSGTSSYPLSSGPRPLEDIIYKLRNHQTNPISTSSPSVAIQHDVYQMVNSQLRPWMSSDANIQHAMKKERRITEDMFNGMKSEGKSLAQRFDSEKYDPDFLEIGAMKI